MMHDALRGDALAAILAGLQGDTKMAEQVAKDLSEHVATIRASLAANRELSLSGRAKTRLNEIAVPLDNYVSATEKIVRLAGENASAAQAAFPEFMNVFRSLETGMEGVSSAIEDEAKTVNARTHALARNFIRVVIGAAIGSMLFMGVLSFVVIWSIPRPFATLIAKLAGSAAANEASASTLAGASGAFSESASEQAASLEETSATIEEIASMTRRNTESAQDAKQLANQTRSAVDAGVVDVGRLSEAMRDVQASGDSIAKIVKTIDEIAFQTNILALNAAVEAARAGEAGAGFAVVAEEVRSLAQRSAVAARETAEKIEGSIEKSRRGMQLSVEVAEGLQQIAEKIHRTDELVAAIAAASQEQNSGIQQMQQTLSQLSATVQANAARAEESAASSADLQAATRAAGENVVELSTLVGGIVAQARPPALAASGATRKFRPSSGARIHSSPASRRTAEPALFV
jgi:methyl-accepting chemotaxis protein